MNENEEKFVIFTTDGNFHEFIPEAEAITAKEIFAEYLRLSEENKHINYLIMCPDGQIRTCAEVIERYIKPPKKMHEEIPGDTKIWKFDGVRAAAVYTGWLTRLEKVKIRWNNTEESREIANACDGCPEFITLDELAAQFPDQLITVVIDDPLSGEIWNYGNSGRDWVRIGITGGYA